MVVRWSSICLSVRLNLDCPGLSEDELGRENGRELIYYTEVRCGNRFPLRRRIPEREDANPGTSPGWLRYIIGSRLAICRTQADQIVGGICDCEGSRWHGREIQ